MVCNNTLAIALGDGAGAVKVSHRTTFDPDAVKRQLGIAVSSWDSFMARMKALADCKVKESTAEAFMRRVLSYPTTSHEAPSATSLRALKGVQSLYQGHGMGAEFASSAGTAWGLLGAVTEYVDHHRRARSTDHRLDAAWFGQGAVIKQKAWDEALKLVA